jgi:hypothetical protein
MRAKDISIPEYWSSLIRRAMIHVASMAQSQIMLTWATTDDLGLETARLKGKLDKMQTELFRKNNQLRIIKARMERIPGKKRPYYSPVERMQILTHRASCFWSLKKN